MKEVVLPVSGDFARIRPVRWSDVRIAIGSPDMMTALIGMVATIDGRAVDAALLDSMALSDAMVISNIRGRRLEACRQCTGGRRPATQRRGMDRDRGSRGEMKKAPAPPSARAFE